MSEICSYIASAEIPHNCRRCDRFDSVPAIPSLTSSKAAKVFSCSGCGGRFVVISLFNLALKVLTLYQIWYLVVIIVSFLLVTTFLLL